jgi:hypothetical protein
LIGDFEKGGLKMIDIESYFISLKASWVGRLADSKYFELEIDTTKIFKCIWENMAYF